MNQVESNNYKNNSDSESYFTLGGNIKGLLNCGFFGSSVMEDEDFLKIVEEFDYSGEDAAKALQFAAACMNYLAGGFGGLL